MTSGVNGNQVQFKLSPTYILYMAVRAKLRQLSRPDIAPAERAHRMASGLLNKIGQLVSQSIQVGQTGWSGLG